MTHPGLLAIDPGASGGMAWVDDDMMVQCDNTPDTSGDFITFLIGLKAAYGQGLEVYMEDPPMGIAGGKFFGPMAKLQRRAGKLEGAIEALGARLILVAPKQWQKNLHIGSRKDHGKDWKNKLKAEAQRRFPGLTVTLKTADALLLLDYARGKITEQQS